MDMTINELDNVLKENMKKVIDFKTLKHFCYGSLLDIILGVVDRLNENPTIKIRYIANREFGITGLGRCAFVREQMYIFSSDKRYEKSHRADIYDYFMDSSFFVFTNHYIVPVNFAGISTGFLDDAGEQIFTGDLVKGAFLPHPPSPSSGGRNRAKDEFGDTPAKDMRYKAGIRNIGGQYAFILDNHFLPLSWATFLKRIGHLFGDLNRIGTEYNIEDACNHYAQDRNKRNYDMSTTSPNITSQWINSLKENEIFVFGSNLQGMHGGGAARLALQWGAVMGQGEGLQGKTYAIPTMFATTSEIEPYITQFLTFAKENPQYTFLVTEIGCGIAGFLPEEIAPLFAEALNLKNVYLPERFVKVITTRI